MNAIVLALTSFTLGILVAPSLVQASHPLGSQTQEEYRAPWPERTVFERNGGCPIDAVGVDGCSGHVGVNAWAVDMNLQDAGDCGHPLRSARNGSTVFLDEAAGGNYGTTIGLRHVAFNGGLTSTWYSHLSQPAFAPWDSVFVQGDWMGAIGDTGVSEGCHLHFQANLGHPGFGPLSGNNTTNVVLSGVPFVNGFDLATFSGDPEHGFRSNNTGAGYCRPLAPPAQDPGPADAPCNSWIRNYVRNAAVYTIDMGSTKASTRGVCGANRRWVKTCSTPFGTIHAQGFVSAAFFGQYPKAIVQSGPSAFSVDGHFWKAYGRKCSINGQNKWVYEHLGPPTTEDEPLFPAPGLSVQYFPGGNIIRNENNPNNITMTVGLNGGGTCFFQNVLDTNNDPCFDLNGDTNVNSGDQGVMGSNLFTENHPLFNDRFDVNMDGYVNSGDQGLLGSQLAQGVTCR